jgi:valyl-tRNA synthetase
MELSTRYTPKEIEGPLYDRWEASGCFTPPEKAQEGRKTFTVMIPPPNVTGVLHMGHALNGTIQDIVIRHRRMDGYDALWVPGTDHAGIATQAVVEKKIYAEEKKTRDDLGREEFLGRIWDWKEKHGAMILHQFRSLGCSCDWTRTKFTMDEDLSLAVRTAFVELWERELIYRGARLVNWDCVLQTAVSDDEIEYVQKKGKLWHLKYPLVEKPGEFLVVATTRPETMLGDTGVAVHPDDERYKALVGTKVKLPFVDREIPIVADDSVDPEYGSGAVKITPGHDPADYERGQRHSLPIISLLNKDGSLNEHGGPFAGKSREVVRKELVAQLDEMGLLGEVEDITHNVSTSDRSKSPIEPLISEQWFVKMQPLAEPAIGALKKGDLQFRPERWGKVYLHWLENVQDWCISRQLWWGHRIPVWYDEDDVGVASIETLEIGAPHPKTGKPIVRQDPDVLDTWASSWLWPLATLGWPNHGAEDLARFYPTQFLSTAQEIIYLWVARMVMAGYAFMPELPEAERNPFTTCYIHATVLDGKGKRMSKSAGNGIDPLDMIEQYGADAVRLSLVLLTKEGQDVRLSPDRFDQGSRFCNKVWNAARFVMMNLEGDRATEPSERFEDRWILSRLARTVADVSLGLNEYRFNDAAQTMYRFVWNDFCDWYVELSKHRLTGDDEASAKDARATLTRVLKDTLVLLHPFTPYLTEALWESLHDTLGEKAPSMLALAPWPSGEGLNEDASAESEMESVQDLVGCVRRVRALTMAAERRLLPVVVNAPRPEMREVLTRHAEAATSLGFIESLEITEGAAQPPQSAVAVAGGIEAYVILGEDVDFAKLKTVLEGRAAKVAKALMGTEKKLQNPGFLAKADDEIIAAEREKLEELKLEKELLERNAAAF